MLKVMLSLSFDISKFINITVKFMAEILRTKFQSSAQMLMKFKIFNLYIMQDVIFTGYTKECMQQFGASRNMIMIGKLMIDYF